MFAVPDILTGEQTWPMDDELHNYNDNINSDMDVGRNRRNISTKVN
jgi:hypothetical protein